LVDQLAGLPVGQIIALSLEYILFLIGQTGKPEMGEPLLNIRCHFHHQLMLLQSARSAFFHLTVIKYEKKRDA